MPAPAQPPSSAEGESFASENVMEAADLQYLLEKVMADQRTNDGVLFLKGDCLPPAAQAQAGLQDLGQGFSLAGSADVVSRLTSDGPGLYISFHVPASLCFQTLQYNPASGTYEAVPEPRELNPAALRVTFAGYEALTNLMAQPSPLRPVINTAGHVMGATVAESI